MTLTHKTPYDVRVVEFHLRNGTITHEEYKQHLKDLADDEAESEETLTTFVPSFEMRSVSTDASANTDEENTLIG